MPVLHKINIEFDEANAIHEDDQGDNQDEEGIANDIFPEEFK